MPSADVDSPGNHDLDAIGLVTLWFGRLSRVLVSLQAIPSRYFNTV